MRYSIFNNIIAIKKYVLMLFALLALNCTNNNTKDVSHLKGYWEITQVKKGNELVKTFSVNTTIDYFELVDGHRGFRKKVSPTLNGKYLVNEDQISFTIKTENDSLHIYYEKNGVQTKETILKIDLDELIIANSQGFKYFYSPFTPINLENE